MSSIAFFDFDDTISNGDSLWHFLRHSFSPVQLGMTFISISPSMVMYKLKLMKNDKAKSRLFSAFFSDLTAEEFDKLAIDFANQKLDSMIKPSALERIKWHQQEGHEVVVVSASPINWLQPWCTKQGVQLIGTQLASQSGKISGEFVGNNCYGKEKEHRIRKTYDLNAYDTIYAYGDSKGDTEMLALADHSYYRSFS